MLLLLLLTAVQSLSLFSATIILVSPSSLAIKLKTCLLCCISPRWHIHISKIGSGFYHSAILNTHDVNGEDKLWELATRSYTSFENAKKSNKHFTDMNDLNFLMCKAIENPSLTPASSLRTAFISVFEDPIIDESNKLHQAIGLEDYIGCSSVHGVGPSIAIFDTIRDGWLDCACVYPSPLHSREQLQQLIDDMKKILVEGGSFGDVETGE